MEQTILIIGATAFLGVNLIAALQKEGFVVETVSFHLGQSLPKDLTKYHCILHLRPTADYTFVTDRPVLAIGSGSVVDYANGRLQLNPYIEDKLLLVKMANVTIHPGFFIPSADHVDTGRGLHRDTLFKLFGSKSCPMEFDLEKSYYMTPVDKLIQLILLFVHEPTRYQGEFAFGSPMPISRRELLANVTPVREKIYAKEMAKTKDLFGLDITSEDIASFHDKANAWVQKNQ